MFKFLAKMLYESCLLSRGGGSFDYVTSLTVKLQILEYSRRGVAGSVIGCIAVSFAGACHPYNLSRT